MDSVKPPRLKKGGTIGLVSPASTPAPREKIEKAVRYLEMRGYSVRLGKYAEAEHGYLAGTDEQRAGDFNAMIRDPAVHAIFALRGGYGTPRLLSLIDYAALRRTPKIISGFSDITALQLAIFKRCRLVTFSGPMPAVEFWKDPDPFTEKEFWRLLTSHRTVGKIQSGAQLLKDGNCRGILLGGNLSLVATLIGTPFLPSMNGNILVLEEVDEAPYRVDRMLTQLINSGLAGKLAGAVLGRFTRCEPKDPQKPHLTITALLREFSEKVSGPVLADFEYGHVPQKVTLPFGLAAEISRDGLKVPHPAVT